ncbi:hypothetical protein [uncultured Clostridium sp.]|uniref:DUF7922 domain-containing protein n=1 Tax=uncultured Clostridium sp. TaxID=59620 RepID=UPI002631E757|nr:hypothetical protein [uncultured Clostridium sp.]
MAHSKLYRSFIILQEDERGHSISKDKPLSGYAKIEVKGSSCKVAFYAQNLKQEYSNCHMMLICNKKDTKTLISLGAMNITEQGKVESSLEHDADNIGSTGVCYDKIVGAAICKEVAGKMVYLMCGFLNGEQPTNNWKDYSKVNCEKTAKKEEKKSYVKEEKKYDDKDHDYSDKKYDHDEKEHYHEKDEKKYKNDYEYHHGKDDKKYDHEEDYEYHHGNKKDKDNYDEEYYDKDDKKDKDYHDKYDKHDDEKEDCGCDDRPNEFDAYEESIKIEGLERNKCEGEFEVKGAMGEFFMNVVEGLEEVTVTDEIKNTKWYKVPVKCFEDMCNICHYNKYTTLYYPMINYYPYIIQKGHFMVGLKCNEQGKIKYLVYGVHGCKDKMSQPYSGKTGFVTFVPDSEGSNTGCWLMFYDFRNSMVVVPMK